MGAVAAVDDAVDEAFSFETLIDGGEIFPGGIGAGAAEGACFEVDVGVGLGEADAGVEFAEIMFDEVVADVTEDDAGFGVEANGVFEEGGVGGFVVGAGVGSRGVAAVDIDGDIEFLGDFIDAEILRVVQGDLHVRVGEFDADELVVGDVSFELGELNGGVLAPVCDVGAAHAEEAGRGVGDPVTDELVGGGADGVGGVDGEEDPRLDLGVIELVTDACGGQDKVDGLSGEGVQGRRELSGQEGLLGHGKVLPAAGMKVHIDDEYFLTVDFHSLKIAAPVAGAANEEGGQGQGGQA